MRVVCGLSGNAKKFNANRTRWLFHCFIIAVLFIVYEYVLSHCHITKLATPSPAYIRQDKFLCGLGMTLHYVDIGDLERLNIYLEG